MYVYDVSCIADEHFSPEKVIASSQYILKAYLKRKRVLKLLGFQQPLLYD